MKKEDINILIVDDDPTVRESLYEAVSRAGFNACQASNASEAITLSKIKLIHGALTDCMLPVTNGVDLAIDLKDQLPNDAPVTLMSGIFKDKSFSSLSLKRSGAQRFLEKPIDLESYITYLNEHFHDAFDQPKVALYQFH